MILDFIGIRIIDIIDIFLVAFLLFQAYLLIRGTVAIRIFIGIFSVYLIWLVVRALNMQLLSTILGQFMGVGMIALIVVFQQEIRRFLLLIGSRYKFDKLVSLDSLFNKNVSEIVNNDLTEILKAVNVLSSKKTGALIVIAKTSELYNIVETGEEIDAKITNNLIQSIFFKNSPLHDGAIVIIKNKIKAVRCILPISSNTNLADKHGLRHRAALGLTQSTDALVIIVSEETGEFSFAHEGKIYDDLSIKDLEQRIINELKS